MECPWPRSLSYCVPDSGFQLRSSLIMCSPENQGLHLCPQIPKPEGSSLLCDRLPTPLAPHEKREGRLWGKVPHRKSGRCFYVHLYSWVAEK